MEKENYIKEIRAGLALLGSFVICISVIYFLKIYFKNHHLYYIIAYLLFILLFSTLLRLSKSQNRILHNVSKVVFLPIHIGYPLFVLFRNIYIPILSFILYMAICLIVPILCFHILERFDIILLKNGDTVLFIKMTMAVFIAVLFNFQIRLFVC